MPNKNNISLAREKVRSLAYSNEEDVLQSLLLNSRLSAEEKEVAETMAIDLVNQLRTEDNPGLMELFLAEYGLSTDEGVALMCLAEALLRVPDSETIDDLIEDKIVSSSWGEHLGRSSSSLVNAATWSLLFTGKVLDDSQKSSVARSLRSAVKRLGEPVVRTAVRQAMKEMGRQFVLGETIESALDRGNPQVKKGYSYSFDMLGEAALTSKDASDYLQSYQHSIKALSANATANTVQSNPGISIKLSALHPRYEVMQHERVMTELVPIVLQLAQQAKISNLGLNIDAEEADRLDLSLDVIEAVLQDSSLEGWDGFGVVVQAYNKCASGVIDWLYALADKHNRKIMVRLVKGAYWDTEIKRAQVEGLSDFAVFTQKASTDVSYLCCAKKLMQMGDRIYPQFATHNAHTVAAVMAIANENCEYEFQRLHGMGESVFQILLKQHSLRCRIYAPVGKHRDLLAYLVRRLLENGANSSFVNQVIDLDVPVNEVVADPFASIANKSTGDSASAIRMPCLLFHPERPNSTGWDLHDHQNLEKFNLARAPFLTKKWRASPLLAKPYTGTHTEKVINPAQPQDVVGQVIEANPDDVSTAINNSRPWHDLNAEKRAEILFYVAELYEENAGEIFALLTREAAKTTNDVVAEIREAVDFLRYYAVQAKEHPNELARGVFVCISPWNFPLAIFTGQICAALAAGNGVLAKPAESTPLIAFLAIQLFHKAGVPRDVLQLLPGQGASIGAQLASAPKIHGVCFTGSTTTGMLINQNMAEHMAPDAPLIAETGGLNAMIVDSTALPEQAITDIVKSAFQSAGQRCSALRILYVQEDIYAPFVDMLFGAMNELRIGNPWQLATDVGPLISKTALKDVQSYIDKAKADNRLLKTTAHKAPTSGYFCAPTLIKVDGIQDMAAEVFGPVLHIATFKASGLNEVIGQINASGYGLTFGLHTRIDSRVEHIINNVNVGNIYINRDQIGAVVGSQPFGGENLSGTGPKAGGPSYLLRFMQTTHVKHSECSSSPIANASQTVSVDQIQVALNALKKQRVKLDETELPGPTGESNKLYEYARGVVLCLGANQESAQEQAKIAEQNGCQSLIVCPNASGKNSIDGFLPRELLMTLTGFDVVALWNDEQSHGADASVVRKALARREGKIIPLICDKNLHRACRLERHVCVDTTASGGNATLIASSM